MDARTAGESRIGGTVLRREPSATNFLPDATPMTIAPPVMTAILASVSSDETMPVPTSPSSFDSMRHRAVA
jgi:hypothetical protein